MNDLSPGSQHRFVSGVVYGAGHDHHDGRNGVLADLDDARNRRFARSRQNLTARGGDVPADASISVSHQGNTVASLFNPPSTAFDDLPDVDAILSDIRFRLRADRRGTPADVGTAVHTVIAALAPVAAEVGSVGLTELVLRLSTAVCAPGRNHRANSTHIAGFANEYLRGPSRPAAPWHHLASEHPVGTGRVDLAWRNGETGAVLFDEIKTTVAARRVCDADWVEQAARYAQAGHSTFHDAFLGVRILPLGSMHVATLVLPSGELRAITPSPTAPTREGGRRE